MASDLSVTSSQIDLLQFVAMTQTALMMSYHQFPLIWASREQDKAIDSVSGSDLTGKTAVLECFELCT